MVVIINGEIVPDNDPRAIARRGSAAPANSGNSNKGPRVMSMGELGEGGGGAAGARRPSQAQATPGGESDDVDGVLTPLSKLLGIAGRRVDIPPVPQLNFTGYSFPLVHLVVAFIVMLFTGNWKYGIAAFIALAVFNPR